MPATGSFQTGESISTFSACIISSASTNLSLFYIVSNIPFAEIVKKEITINLLANNLIRANNGERGMY